MPNRSCATQLAYIVLDSQDLCVALLLEVNYKVLSFYNAKPSVINYLYISSDSLFFFSLLKRNNKLAANQMNQN